MARDASRTRTAILDAAEQLTLERGFAGAGVDRILELSGTSKGAFFHHFDSKGALADALIRRWADADQRHIHDKLGRAERLVEDPLEQLLVFLGLFIEEADASEGEIPGCLFAAYSYQSDLFEPDVRAVLRTSMLEWRSQLLAKLEEVEALHSPVADVDLEAVADSFNVIFEGALVVSRSVGEPKVLGAQLRLFRTSLRSLFSGGAAGALGSVAG